MWVRGDMELCPLVSHIERESRRGLVGGLIHSARHTQPRPTISDCTLHCAAIRGINLYVYRGLNAVWPVIPATALCPSREKYPPQPVMNEW